MIFFNDVYNLYTKLWSYENQIEPSKIIPMNDDLIYNNWEHFLNLKNSFLLDLSNIIYDFQFNYKNSPTHLNNKSRNSSHEYDYNSIKREDNICNETNDYYYLCDCNELFRVKLQDAIHKLVLNSNKEWVNTISIDIVHECFYLLKRIKELKNEYDIYIYDDIENQNAENVTKYIHSSNLLYNSVCEILFNNDSDNSLYRLYNKENNIYQCYYCEEEGMIINKMCYECYLYIDVSNSNILHDNINNV